MNIQATKKVVVGMSGGVDSSVTAFLLKEQGYEVIGVHLLMEERKRNSQAILDAKKVAEKLEIEFHIFDFTQEFTKKVIEYFIEDYSKGLTPNPCIMCNRFIKFEALLARANKLGAQYIATGHYAKIMQLDNDRYTLTKADNDAKDQTYALYRLTQAQLAHVLMPVGKYSKDEIRELATKAGLHLAKKADSQEICFIDNDDYVSFLAPHLNKKLLKHGDFITSKGEKVGEHTGITNYTIGQRRGLKIAMGYPIYVTNIDTSANEITVGPEEQLYKTRLVANRLSFMGIEPFTGSLNLVAKIRYSDPGALCTVTLLDNDTVECIFEHKVRAITPGQSVVFYINDQIAFGGFII